MRVDLSVISRPLNPSTDPELLIYLSFDPCLSECDHSWESGHFRKLLLYASLSLGILAVAATGLS